PHRRGDTTARDNGDSSHRLAETRTPGQRGQTPPARGDTAARDNGDRPRRSRRPWRPRRMVGAVPTCSELSVALGEPLHATAPYAPTWLLVEVPGAWARKAVREAGLGELERRAKEHSVRVGLVRRFGRRQPHARQSRVFVARCTEPSLEELADVDPAALDPADLPRGEPVPRPLYLVCTNGRRDVCCGRAGA